MLKPVALWVLIFYSVNFTAQNNFTFTNDSYSGINATVSSPTQNYFNPNPWDVNMISADLFLDNDYAYISKQSILGLRNASIQTANPKKGITGATQANIFDFYNRENANLVTSMDILGPSFSITTTIKPKSRS